MRYPDVFQTPFHSQLLLLQRLIDLVENNLILVGQHCIRSKSGLRTSFSGGSFFDGVYDFNESIGGY